jgi:hypothetical protein
MWCREEDETVSSFAMEEKEEKEEETQQAGSIGIQPNRV